MKDGPDSHGESSADPGDTGSDPSRDPARQLVYLAAERTLLTWLRAAVTLMILGFAVDRFALLLPDREGGGPFGAAWSTWIGVTLIAAGVLTSAVSALRYQRFERRYARGDSRPGPGLPLAIALSCVLVLAGTGLAIYLWLTAG